MVRSADPTVCYPIDVLGKPNDGSQKLRKKRCTFADPTRHGNKQPSQAAYYHCLISPPCNFQTSASFGC